MTFFGKIVHSIGIGTVIGTMWGGKLDFIICLQNTRFLRHKEFISSDSVVLRIFLHSGLSVEPF